MANKRKQINFNAKIVPIKPLNDEFTLCRCYVMALNKNRNLSYIGKESVNAAMPTLFNIPVIGHLYADSNGNFHMGGHDMELVKDADGQYLFKSLCVPYGTVPSDNNITFEDITEPNGDVKTYLCADIILWTGRFPELKEAIYSEKTYFGQSMEINVSSYEPLEEDKNYLNILSYSYSGLCLLGKSDNPDEHVEPCFPMSRIEPYEFQLDDKFSELLSQLKSELTACFENSGKGGENMDETKNITEESVANAEIPVTHNNEAGEESTETKTPTNTNEPTEPNGEHNAENNFEQNTFAATFLEKYEAIRNALPEYCEHDEKTGGLTTAYYHCLCDFNENYAFVERYGFVDCKDTTQKGRYAYVYDNTTKTAAITGNFEKMFVKWLTENEVRQIEEKDALYEELVEYKKTKVNAEKEAEFDAVLAEFADLENIEAFVEIVKNRANYDTAEALKNACYIIRGKFSAPTPQRKNASEPSVPIGEKKTLTALEEFMEKYGSKK